MTVETKVMEVKKTGQTAFQATKEAAVRETLSSDTKPSVKIGEFIGDVKEEVWRITWPSVEELRNYTQIVVGMTFALGLGIYFSDLIIQSILNGINVVLRWIVG